MTTEKIVRIQFAAEQGVHSVLGSLLHQFVSVCASNRGGVVAVCGMPGTGKSTLAQEFTKSKTDATYHDGLIHQEPLLPVLHGVAVIDEVWNYKNAADAIASHVTKNKGVVVALSCHLDELEKICGEHIKSVIEITHWHAANPSGIPVVETKRKDGRKGRGKIKFRGPTGETWSGVGRTPKWLMALEIQGHSRDAFRVDSPVDQKSMKG